MVQLFFSHVRPVKWFKELVRKLDVDERPSIVFDAYVIRAYDGLLSCGGNQNSPGTTIPDHILADSKDGHVSDDVIRNGENIALPGPEKICTHLSGCSHLRKMKIQISVKDVIGLVEPQKDVHNDAGRNKFCSGEKILHGTTGRGRTRMASDSYP